MAREKSIDDIIDEVTDRPPPSEDALTRVRNHVREARDLAMEIADRMSHVNEMKQRHWKLLNETLPEMFGDLGISSIALEAEGNMPAFEARAAPFCKANIAADWPEERRQAAFQWLREHDLGDLIKAEYVVEFGMDTQKQQKKLVTALEKLGLDYEVGEAVPWNTLTAVVRDMWSRGDPFPLETIGATVGTAVTVREVKPRTNRRN